MAAVSLGGEMPISTRWTIRGGFNVFRTATATDWHIAMLPEFSFGYSP